MYNGPPACIINDFIDYLDWFSKINLSFKHQMGTKFHLIICDLYANELYGILACM